MAGATITGAVDARHVAVMTSSDEAVGHRGHPARRRGRHQDRIGRVRGHDVPDATVGQQLQGIEHHAPPAEGLERERPDELRSRCGS